MSETSGNATNGETRRIALAEVGLIFVLFFLHAGWLTPDVNEAHYLAKAKHYWNPQWCAGDHFLESADAHQVFYWTFGWLTLCLPLPAVAWVGRIATWLLLAAGWQRLSAALMPRRWASVLSAGLMLTFTARCHMAGEWIVGGVEAKGFAFALVFFGLAELVRGRWNRTWLLLGGASAFHVLVGGWSVVAAGVAWLLTSPRDRPRLRAMLPGLSGGLALSLPGLIPALTLTVADAETVARANQIYVQQRLPHHLVLSYFAMSLKMRFTAMTALWAGGCWLLPADGPRRRWRRFVFGALLIAACGAAIDLAMAAWPRLSIGLLRYYWFRLADVTVPMAAALMAPLLLTRLAVRRRTVATAALLLVIVAIGAHLGEAHYRRWWVPRGGADSQALPAPPGSRWRTWVVYRDWRDVCLEVRNTTTPTARFLTPMRQQTFKWYAGRSEVVSYKDVPQDAASIVEWDRRFRDVYPISDAGFRVPISAFSSDRLRYLAKQYDFRYVVCERSQGRPRAPCVCMYWNNTYAVYRLTGLP